MFSIFACLIPSTEGIHVCSSLKHVRDVLPTCPRRTTFVALNHPSERDWWEPDGIDLAWTQLPTTKLSTKQKIRKNPAGYQS